MCVCVCVCVSVCVSETQLVTHGDRALSAITAPASPQRPLTIMLLLPWLQIHSFHSICIWRERDEGRSNVRDERGKKTESRKETILFFFFFSLYVLYLSPHHLPLCFNLCVIHNIYIIQPEDGKTFSIISSTVIQTSHHP